MPAGINRSQTLYPVNSTTVDTGAGIDVRLLDIAQAGADDTSQSAQFTHTNDSVERTYDPGNASVTNTNNANTTLFKTGWALRLLEDMTPPNDTVFDAFLNAGTLTVSMVITPSQAGGTYVSGTYQPTFRASLWRYNPATDTGTVIASGTSSSTSWDVTPATGDIGTAKTISVSIVVTDTTFGAVGGTAAEILFLQLGFNTGTVPNPTLGTATFTQILTVDNTNTNITFASGQGIHQIGTLSTNVTGAGTVTRNLAATMSRNATGVGTSTSTKATVASKTFNLVGNGTVVMTKNTQAQRTFNLNGTGTVTRQFAVQKANFNLTGVGTPTNSKVTVASKTFSLSAKGTVTHIKALTMSRNATGVGTVTNVHPVAAFRTFNLIGAGEVLVNGANGTTITLPIDEVPTGGGGGTTIIKKPTYIFDD